MALITSDVPPFSRLPGLVCRLGALSPPSVCGGAFSTFRSPLSARHSSFVVPSSRRPPSVVPSFIVLSGMIPRSPLPAAPTLFSTI